MAWGGATRPLSLTPQFFPNKPLDLRLTLVSQVVTQALQRDRGHHFDETTRDDGME